MFTEIRKPLSLCNKTKRYDTATRVKNQKMYS